jgi:phage baseplate assembly protein W
MGWLMETSISLPFKVTSYGSIATTTEQSKIWSDRVRAVIGTNIKERVMLPDFGTLVPEAFMQTEDDAESTIKTEVERGFTKYLDQLNLSSVNITFDEYTNTTNVVILYQLPNNEEASVTIGIVTNIGTLPQTQENL